MNKKVAIDCSKLDSEYQTGTHRFLICFLNELTKNKGFEFYFYTNSTNTNLKKHLFSQRGSIISLRNRPLYTQLGLLKEIGSYDYFIFPWQTMPFLSLFSKTKKISIIHDTGYSFISKITTFLTLLISNQLFSVSLSTAKKLFRKSIIISEGVDSSIFYPIDSLELKKFRKDLDIPDFFILSLGRIEKRKNIYNNLSAFAQIKKYYPNLKYIFIGKFIEDENKIYSFIKSLGLNRGDILFKNNINDADLNIYLNCMEFLVFTSFEEGFGLPVLESYSVYKPVILSKIEQLAEFNLSANQYVDPKDIEKISEKMVFFLRKQYNFSKKDYKVVLSKFSWKNSSDIFLKNLN
jgi:glycosyltransferase involved in cell wall biosynthesis